MSALSPVLSLNNLSIMRGDTVLCRQVNLSLNQGDICHLVGQNGLGKTTLLMQLVGILPTLEGQIECLGETVARGALYMPHQAGIHENLNVYQNLAFLSSLYNVKASQEQLDWALAEVGLAGYGEVSSVQLSAGQTRRVGLARLWLMGVEDAPLWILDEPLTALDVAMIDKLLLRLQAFAKAGGAVLLTSHQPIACANKVLDLTAFVGGDDD